MFRIVLVLFLSVAAAPDRVLAEEAGHDSAHAEKVEHREGSAKEAKGELESEQKGEALYVPTDPDMSGLSPEMNECDPPVPVALELFKSPTALVRKFGAERLILCSYGARPAIEELKQLLSDKDLEVRLAAARALAGTKSSKMPVAELLALLVANLDHKNVYIRRKAATGLAVLTDPAPLGETYRISVPEGRFVTRALVKISKDPDGVIQAAIAHTFGNLQVASVLPLLRDMTQSPHWQVRREAVVSLGRFEGKGKQYSPAVAKVFREDPSYEVRKVAADTLLSFGDGNSVAEVKKCAVSEGKAPYQSIFDYCVKLDSTFELN